MHVLNIHERTIAAPIDRVGGLIDTPASPGDRLWPHELWPAMRFDRPLAVGARGGHGPIRYDVAAYEPGRSVRFRFTGPKGFNGFHELVAEPRGPGSTCLRHTLQMRTTGLARLSWPLLYRPLHDALVEDALDKGERSLGCQPAGARWSARVRLLRWIVSRSRKLRVRGIKGIAPLPSGERT